MVLREVSIRIGKSYVYISAEVCKQIPVLLVWRGVGYGGWRGLPLRRHSYRGHRVELWRASDWLKTN